MTEYTTGPELRVQYAEGPELPPRPRVSSAAFETVLTPEQLAMIMSSLVFDEDVADE